MKALTAERALELGLFGFQAWAEVAEAPEVQWVTAWTYDALFGTVTYPTEQGAVTVAARRFLKAEAAAAKKAAR
jgi:hypothetical protein